jgi:hypothetical protein
MLRVSSRVTIQNLVTFVLLCIAMDVCWRTIISCNSYQLNQRRIGVLFCQYSAMSQPLFQNRCDGWISSMSMIWMWRRPTWVIDNSNKHTVNMSNSSVVRQCCTMSDNCNKTVRLYQFFAFSKPHKLAVFFEVENFYTTKINYHDTVRKSAFRWVARLKFVRQFVQLHHGEAIDGASIHPDCTMRYSELS